MGCLQSLSQSVLTDSPYGAPSEVKKIYQSGFALHVITGSGAHMTVGLTTVEQ